MPKISFLNLLNGLLCFALVGLYIAFLDNLYEDWLNETLISKIKKINKIQALIYTENNEFIQDTQEDEYYAFIDFEKQQKDGTQRFDEFVRHIRIESSKKYIMRQIQINQAKEKIKTLLEKQ